MQNSVWLTVKLMLVAAIGLIPAFGSVAIVDAYTSMTNAEFESASMIAYIVWVWGLNRCEL